MERIALFGGAPVLDNRQHRRWPAVTSEERESVGRVLDRGVLSGPLAPEATAFEAEFARFVGAKHALLTHSGTSALHLALVAAGVRAGDHVVVPAFSFVATPLAVLQAGAIPIFADVDPINGLLTAGQAAEVLTPRTRAIVPVHIHGAPADLSSLLDLASKRGISVVEDAAQAHGALYQGRPVGAIGHTGAFSLQSSKNLGAGEGGVFVTNDARAAQLANEVRNFGQNVAAELDTFDSSRPLDGTRPLDSLRVGWMYRGNELLAAFARAQLRRLPERTSNCQRNAERLASALGELPGVRPVRAPVGSTSAYHKFRVTLDPREAGVDLPPKMLRGAVIRALKAEGLEVVLWQTVPLPAQTIFQRRDGFGGGWPWSTDPETDFGSMYDPAHFSCTQRLLDGSIVLFSQSCPLIAQSDDIVDAYAEAFARVWRHRRDLAIWAEREARADDSGG
jgi:dTDP-4-amino-4,6-dideoxygalactose transaminase